MFKVQGRKALRPGPDFILADGRKTNFFWHYRGVRRGSGKEISKNA